MIAIREQDLKEYLIRTYNLHPGQKIERVEKHEEDKKLHIYKVIQIYPHCILLEDIKTHIRICPCYGKLSLMLGGLEQ